MAANGIREKRKFLAAISQPATNTLPVSVAVQSTITVIASNGATAVLSPNRVYDLLQTAPLDAWKRSASLLRAFDTGLLTFNVVTVETGAVVRPSAGGIVPPDFPVAGDLLVHDGADWVGIPASEVAGSVLTSRGKGEVPEYRTVQEGLTPESITLRGVSVSGAIPGDAVYASSGAWAPCSSDSLNTARCAGILTADGLVVGGVVTVNVTAGSKPSIGSRMWLASAKDDDGVGAGKVTATMPSKGVLAEMGTCVDVSDLPHRVRLRVGISPVVQLS